MLNINLFDENVPATQEMITVVTEYDSSGLLIQDYINGNPVNEGIYVSCVDFDDAILTYDYRNETAYVECSVEGKFQVLREQAELFKECGGSIERYAEAMEERLENMDFPEDDEF